MGGDSEMSSIPKGYKKTEVGVIPDDWEVKILGEEGVFLTTSSYTRSELREYGDVACIHYGDIHTRFHTWLDCSSIALPMISKDMVKQYPYLKNGDLVIADASEDYEGLGDCVEICNIDSRLCIGGLHTIVYRAKFGLFAPSYIGLLRNLQVVRNQLISQAVGTKVYSLTTSMIGSISVPIPTLLSEQEAIAEVLSDMDALIEAQKELIAKKRDIKQGTMQDLLSGRVRLPGYETKGWKHTDIGDIPDDWDVWKLGEICQCDMNTLPSSTDPNYSFTYISLECIDSGILTNTFEYIFSKAPSRARKIVNQYNILISTVRPNLRSHYYQSSPCENLICSTGFTVLQTNNNAGKFIFYHFFSNIINKQIETIVSGSNYPSISTRDVACLQLPLPSYSEQQAIAETLSDMDNELETLEAELEKLHHMKRGMMQELLTGRIRLI